MILKPQKETKFIWSLIFASPSIKQEFHDAVPVQIVGLKSKRNPTQLEPYRLLFINSDYQTSPKKSSFIFCSSHPHCIEPTFQVIVK